MCVIIMQKWISFVFADNLDEVLVQITLMSRGKGLEREMEMPGCILAPAFFVLKLPVALVRAPGKFALGSGGWVKILLCVDAGQNLRL